MASPNTHLLFTLDDEFVNSFPEFPSWWQNLNYIVFYRTYSRLTPDGAKETFRDVARRYIEGMFSEQQYHVETLRIPWDREKAMSSAEEAFTTTFDFLWTPPGRGMWMMGTPYVHGNMHLPRTEKINPEFNIWNPQTNQQEVWTRQGNLPSGAALQNCAFVSTDEDFIEAMLFLMDASMLGVGVGFDVRGAGKHKVYKPDGDSVYHYPIADSREGWVDSTRVLLEMFLTPDHPTVSFDYSAIRPEGELIKGFGGVTAGPQPLIDMHFKLAEILSGYIGKTLDSRAIVDSGNLIGKCVVSGNVRRSAEWVGGRLDDEDFLSLKDSTVPQNVERTGNEGWSWVSNNSVFLYDHDEPDYDLIAERVGPYKGDPGILWMDRAREYGRLIDPPNHKDHRAMGTNPCGEQTLESFECCNLVETYPSRATSFAEWDRALKFAYLYAKTVTLLPTHWPRTNQIMLRNRRIGASVSGMAEFVDQPGRGWKTAEDWLDAGYATIQEWDEIYSEWLCVRQSIKTTSVKPSGTVSKLAAVTAGAHWPVATFWIQRIRFNRTDPLVGAMRQAGYVVEPCFGNETTTVVVEIPTRGADIRDHTEVSVYEKFAMAALLQRWWADNQVSVTITFNPDEEVKDLAAALKIYDGQLKSWSAMTIDNEAFPQMPMTSISREEYEARMSGVQPIDYASIYKNTSGHDEAVGELYCSTDTCEIKYDEG